MTKSEFIAYIEGLNATEFEALQMKLGMTDKSEIEKKFVEFINIFPVKTPSGRPLRPKKITAKQNIMAKKLFLKDIRSLEDAQIAIDGLKIELEERRQQNSMEYIQNLLTYIRNNNWDEFYDEDKVVPEVSEEQSTFMF